ncbi:MAG: hypothetical protein AVDCRST_MAG27-2163 [uncultured Craurococcus sp.]|uniref:Uncharacterized protein n=1 Tax=uncultured Craurococcus sp. TaxID=1135998 RepID=A0A6J4HX26_9PROT|nr:MAG: hypothetical protein AVDCRST_MAG27-2163 [uncultured Craurococcus sp.]
MIIISLSAQVVLCQVDMRQVVQGGTERGYATPDAEWVVASCIPHEPGHTLRDAKPPIVMEPAPADRSAFETGFGRANAGARP